MASGFCVDLLCLKCGALWCDRGCNTNSGPSEERIVEWEKAPNGKARWNGKFYTSGGVYGPERRSRCSHCNGDEVVWWH